MAETDYVHGEMNIKSQKDTWDGFMKAGTWGGFATLLIVGYLTFTLAMGMNWLVSLVILAGVSIVGGLAMGMGGAWIAVVIGLSGLAVIVQVIIAVFQMVM